MAFFRKSILLLFVASTSVASVSDNFNRANGGVGSNWTDQQQSATITTNEAYTNQGNYGSAYWSANSFNDNQTSQIVIKNTTLYVAAACRMSGTGSGTNWYAAFSHGSLQKCVAGSCGSVIASYTSAIVGDTIKIDCNGSTIRVYINGSEVGGSPFSDSSLPTGSPGIVWFATSAAADDFLATGETGGAAPSLPPQRLLQGVGR